MEYFYFGRVKPADVNSCTPKKVELIEKLSKVGASFVVYKCVWNQPGCKSVFNNPDAEFNIFAHPGDFVSSRLFIHLARNPHIKTARMKGTGVFFISPDTAGCKRGCHSIADRLLDRRKARMLAVRTSISIQPMFIQKVIYRLKIVGRNQAIRIKNNKVITVCTLKPIIATESLP